MKDRPKIGVVYGALAFDLRIADPTRRRSLQATEAEALATALRRNLIAECADVRALRLTIGAAFYDPCALLRIGSPLHRRLQALCAYTVESEGDAIVGFGEGGLPEPRGFAAARELLSLPFVLEGPVESAKEAARQFDRNHMRPYTPRARNPAFDLPSVPAFDAVGYLSLRSLSAEIGGRYYAEGLGDVWALIERILREPDRAHALEARPGAISNRTRNETGSPWLHYADGRVRIDGGAEASNERCRRLLTAHGLKVDTIDRTQQTEA